MNQRDLDDKIDQIDGLIKYIDYEYRLADGINNFMTSSILILLGVLSLILTAAVVFSRRSAFACVATSLFALGFAAFCAFGFLASFELSDSSKWPWQLAYAIIGIGSLVAAFLGLKGAWNHALAETKD